MNEIKVVYEPNLSVFDEVEANTNHRLEYDDGEFSCVYPVTAEITDYVVAVFSVEDGIVDLPDGSAILEADGDSVVALVPKEVYSE